MNDLSEYNQAKALLRAKDYKRAIETFEKIADRKSIAAAEAAYSLGIIYESGSGVEVVTETERRQRAKQYYESAEGLGYSMATYRLAGLLSRSGQPDAALQRYRLIASSNPSAAYWASQIIEKNPHLALETEDPDQYLSKAAEMGHVRAKKLIVLNNLRGKNGLAGFVKGVFSCLALPIVTWRTVKAGDKLKYE